MRWRGVGWKGSEPGRVCPAYEERRSSNLEALMNDVDKPVPNDLLIPGWDRLKWRERRARRLRRWIGAKNVPFATTSARSAYAERVQLLIDALRLLKPDRVPVSPMMGFYPVRYAGLSHREAMYDYERLAAAQIAFYEEFRPDYQSQPAPPRPSSTFWAYSLYSGRAAESMTTHRGSTSKLST